MNLNKALRLNESVTLQRRGMRPVNARVKSIEDGVLILRCFSEQDFKMLIRRNYLLVTFNSSLMRLEIRRHEKIKGEYLIFCQIDYSSREKQVKAFNKGRKKKGDLLPEINEIIWEGWEAMV